ncbi:23 kDa integral membrane protein-like [Physella acuta]|uniref:23 kDa integral membrane protein-like n=1 Tax=Physella acuta TaxID=109671 RepID=UPI0027DC9FAE|nr:23 kDa integral membrane protein-like [Physella acuta]XP_059154280.1 23 kDa integral membrane protein-like [Physella acuta]XP_059154281.1 23 kDa integral membrane protein-like [Physella acuta]
MACATIGKCILILLNVVFLIISLGLVAIGAILAFIPGTVLKYMLDAATKAASTAGYTMPKDVNDLKDLPMVYEVGVALFILGLVLFAISFMGCCGSCSSCCKCLLLGFALVMICLMIAELVVVTMFYVPSSPIHSTIRTTLKDKIKTDYNENGTDPFSQSINLVNHYFECCGIDGESDFIPKSHRSCDSTNKNGCYTKLTNLIQDNIIWAGLALGGVLALQLIEVIFAVVIFKDNKISPI